MSEVANRALKVVWHQKWNVWRRQRPEAYAGMLQMQVLGGPAGTRPYGLPQLAAESVAGQAIRNKHDTLFLPMAFSAGSPAHPAYGAGHATVAGACVTVLKAWFQEDARIADILQKEKPVSPFTGAPVRIVNTDDQGGEVLPDYTGSDKAEMTVAGELKKIACNVAMGRSMGGAHWRTDNTRSLRLGEQVATIILKRQSVEWAERHHGGPVRLTYRSFDGDEVGIGGGVVTVNGQESALTPDLIGPL